MMARPNYSEMDDDEVFRRASDGDGGAYEELFRRLRKQAVAVAERIWGEQPRGESGPEDVGNDAASEVLERWRAGLAGGQSRPAGRGAKRPIQLRNGSFAALRSLVIKRARWRVADAIRERRRERIAEPSAEGETGDGPTGAVSEWVSEFEDLEADRRIGLLARAITQLNPKEREVLTLSVWEEMSSREIAVRCGFCSENAVNIFCHRVRAKLKALILRLGDDGA